MIKATKNGDFSTKNVVDEYSRLNDYTSDSTYMSSGANHWWFRLCTMAPAAFYLSLFLGAPCITYKANYKSRWGNEGRTDDYPSC